MPLSEIDQRLIALANDVFKLAGDVYRDSFGGDRKHQREFCRRVAVQFADKVGLKVVDIGVVAKSVDELNRGPRDTRMVRQPAVSSRPKRSGAIRIQTANESVVEASEIAEQIISLADSGDLPSAGIDYAERVAGKARDILDSIEESNRVTPGQFEALRNMLDGLERWFQYGY